MIAAAAGPATAALFRRRFRVVAVVHGRRILRRRRDDGVEFELPGGDFRAEGVVLLRKGVQSVGHHVGVGVALGRGRAAAKSGEAARHDGAEGELGLGHTEKDGPRQKKSRVRYAALEDALHEVARGGRARVGRPHEREADLPPLGTQLRSAGLLVLPALVLVLEREQRLPGALLLRRLYVLVDQVLQHSLLLLKRGGRRRKRLYGTRGAVTARRRRSVRRLDDRRRLLLDRHELRRRGTLLRQPLTEALGRERLGLAEDVVADVLVARHQQVLQQLRHLQRAARDGRTHTSRL
mmetsp:Transcript_25822/g.79446  ORF Transcript_25822/g.79446 Transcript_25822/m.79446 type:complete len:294 (-) Transcript_25822:143-1024(-)